MQWLNYHHLLYFWVVAKEGSVAKATKELRLAQPTISGQIRRLEEVVGEKLFSRRGRGLELTEIGRVVFRYADDIFALGRELQDTLKGTPVGKPLELAVGVADVVPKMVARLLLEPALKLPEPMHLVCREAKPDGLLDDLSLHELDVVLADSPVGPSQHVRAFNHLLVECNLVFLGTKELCNLYQRGFPKSLHCAPVLLPTQNTALRRSLNQWFATRGIEPQIVGEFEDSALLNEFGQAGLGLFPAPAIAVREIQARYALKRVGTVKDVFERYYAISVERKLEHPGVIAITRQGQKAKRERRSSGSV